jgi:hypothetical protein
LFLITVGQIGVDLTSAFHPFQGFGQITAAFLTRHSIGEG